MSAYRYLRRFVGGESGATTAEYAVMAAFVVLVVAAGVMAFRTPAGSAITSTGSSIGTYPDP